VTSPTALRTRAGWDIALSIILLAIALVGLAISAFGQLFIAAFTDYCPPATCHVDQGIGEVFAVYGVVSVLLVVSIVLTIVFLVTRRRAWWIALIGLVIVIVGAITAFVLYLVAVGGTA
jgi:uncharacterized BrkB/YihY/UPF0761 family membrane protein